MAYTLDYECPVERSVRPFCFTDKLLLTAGPCTVSPRVLQALAQPIEYPFDLVFDNMMVNIMKMLRYVFQTNNEITFAHHTSASGGIEAMIANLTEPGETVIFAVAGFWGGRIYQFGERYELNRILLEAKPREVFTLQELEDAIKKYQPSVLFIVHGETSAGIIQPLEGLGDICHRYNCLLAVDAVVSTAAVPLFVDRWKIDAVVAGTQKAIGAPPGLALTTYSPLAKKRMLSRKKPVAPYYLDVLSAHKAWDCFEQGTFVFHHTMNSNMLAALHEALAAICEEGLENTWQRHKICNEMLWKGSEQLGLKLVIEKPESRLHGISIIGLPDDVNVHMLLQHISQEYKVLTTFGFGPTAGNNLRVGILGYNARPEVVKYFLRILKESVELLRKENGKKLENCNNYSFSLS